MAFKDFFNFKYKLLFSNGAPNGPPYTPMDHVQQLLNHYYNEYNKNANNDISQNILPYGFDIKKSLNCLSEDQKSYLFQIKKLIAL